MLHIYYAMQQSSGTGGKVPDSGAYLLVSLADSCEKWDGLQIGLLMQAWGIGCWHQAAMWILWGHPAHREWLQKKHVCIIGMVCPITWEHSQFSTKFPPMRLIWAGCFNTLRPRRNEQHFADNIFKHIFFNENVWISIKIPLKFVPKGPINNIPALVQIMAWRQSGDKPLSEPMMVSLPTHICVTRTQWVNAASISCLSQ